MRKRNARVLMGARARLCVLALPLGELSALGLTERVSPGFRSLETFGVHILLRFGVPGLRALSVGLCRQLPQRGSRGCYPLALPLGEYTISIKH